jgi:hypothetical protein
MQPKKIELKKLKVKEVFYYDRFKRDPQSEAFVINYEYDNKVCDDLQVQENFFHIFFVLRTIPAFIFFN